MGDGVYTSKDPTNSIKVVKGGEVYISSTLFPSLHFPYFPYSLSLPSP